MANKGIQKYIATSQGIVYISTILAGILRCGSLFFYENKNNYDALNDGFLWSFFAPAFSNIYVSYISSFICSIGIALFFTYINEKYTIIRIRTSLPYAFCIFLLACFPPLGVMSPIYIGLFCILQTINVLYSSYQSEQVSGQAYKMGFILAAGSLFTPNIMLFLLIIPIGFFTMRSFNYKVILTLLLGAATIYWLLGFGLLIWTDLSNPLFTWIERWRNFTIPDFGKEHISSWIYFIFNILIVIFIIIYNYINSFKDKIQVRAYLSFYNTLFIFSCLVSISLLLTDNISFVMISVISAFIYSHYFALVHNKSSIYFFWGLILYYIGMYLSSFSLF